jgi:hypothetical protein
MTTTASNSEFSNTPISEWFGDYMPEIERHILGLRRLPDHPSIWVFSGCRVVSGAVDVDNIALRFNK